MLVRLEISNFALIDKATIDFNSGMTVLTGETGAGKSILIDAIGAVCGQRISKDCIRTNANSAVIIAYFSNVSNYLVDELYRDLIDDEDDDELILYREITNDGKSFSKINGKTVPLSVLKNVGMLLINIHGQNENQSLFNDNEQLNCLDKFVKIDNMEIYYNYEKIYTEYLLIKKELSDLVEDDLKRTQLIDFLTYQINEIKAANIKPNEDEKLTEKRKILANSEKIIRIFMFAKSSLDGESQFPVIPTLKNIATQIRTNLSGIEKYIEYADLIEENIYSLSDIFDNISNELDNFDINPKELEKVDERLNLLFNLKKKYGGSIEKIFAHLEISEKKLAEILDSEANINKLKNRLESLCSSLYKISTDIHNLREKTALQLELKILAELSDLGMGKTQFKIYVTRLEQNNYLKHGQDSVEFMISPNPGEELKPLSRIASGGEAARIMLAVKSIIAEVDNIPVLIFDEVDTGISGKTAGFVGDKMHSLSSKRQILCVTHMAQISARADNHIFIEKYTEDDRTYTKLRIITGDERIKEVARLLDGIQSVEATSLAKSMIYRN